MKIITDGDSFATRWKVEKAWPDYVREHYNVDLSNYSVAGSSNKQIVERLRENVLKESPDIILVMLTYQLRDYDIPDELDPLVFIQRYNNIFYSKMDYFIPSSMFFSLV